MNNQIVWNNKEVFIQADSLISSPKFYEVINRLNKAKKLNAVRSVYGMPLLNEGKWSTTEQRNQLALIYTQQLWPTKC